MRYFVVLLSILALPLYAAEVTSPQEAAELVMEEHMADDMTGKAVYSFPTALAEGDAVDSWHESVPVPFDGYLILIDDMALANWEHPCRWVFVASDGRTEAVHMYTPPEVFPRMTEEYSDIPISYSQAEARQELLDSFVPNPRSVDNPENCYAWLVSGGASQGSNYPRYYFDVQYLYLTITQDYGYLDDHVIVCFADGTDPAPDNSNGENSNPDLDDDGDTDINYDATFAGVQSGYNDIENMVGSDDYLLIMTTDHGGSGKNHMSPLVPPEVYLNLWNSETLDDDTFDDWLEDLNANNVNVIMEQCFSGGFLEEVVTTSTDQDRVFSSACNGYEYSYGGSVYDDWVYWWTCAMHGETHTGDSLAYDPDTDGDGFVNYGEAFDAAYDWDPWAQSGSEHPQYGDNPDSCGDVYWLGGQIEESIEGELNSPILSSASLTVAPNPVATTASASFRLNAGAAVNLAIYDVSGRRVASMVSGDLEGGSHSFVWDTASEPSGVYLLVLRAGDSVATTKVVRISP